MELVLRAYELNSTLNGENIDGMEKYLIECEGFKRRRMVTRLVDQWVML
jgi:hypothetical protein